MSNQQHHPVTWHPPAGPKPTQRANIQPDIVLTTLNARYIHASLGLRYLYANMGPLQQQTHIREFTIKARVQDIAEQLLNEQPGIIGIGVYIWNVRESTELVQLIKTVSPETIVIIGGPEVSYEYEKELIFKTADYLITGQADFAFTSLCQQIMSGNAPATKVIKASNPAIAELILPYEHYSDEDIKNRVVYVEASRGCPFKCEFCLSSLDKTAWPFAPEIFLNAMDTLYQRGLRHFKFVDRTFNLKIATTCQILEFFLSRADDGLFLHFEVIPDKLPEQLKTLLTQFPAGVLQFEVGIQTFNPNVQSIINRKQNNEKSVENLKWLRQNTNAHIHADLIFGLPGETLDSMAQGFNELLSTGVQEIQVGILKRLRGTPITALTEQYGMRYSPTPPYALLANDQIDFYQMQRLTRFSRYWDLVANSGRYGVTLKLLLGDSSFQRFLAFSDWCSTHRIPSHGLQPQRMMDTLHDALIDLNLASSDDLIQAINVDYRRYNGKPPQCLQSDLASSPSIEKSEFVKQSKRQRRHQINVT